jgi:potassium-dependent mechanosensitive channel
MRIAGLAPRAGLRRMGQIATGDPVFRAIARVACQLVLLFALTAPAHAQLPATAPAPPAAAPAVAPAVQPQAPPQPGWIRPEEVPTRADALLAQIDAARLDPAKQARVGEIERNLVEITPQLDKLSTRVQAALATATPLDKLDELAREVAVAAASLDKWQETLQAEAVRVGDVSTRLAQQQAIWSATLARPEVVEADPVVSRRIRASLELLRQTSADLRGWSDRVLALADRIVERRGELTAEVASVQQNAAVQRTALLIPSQPPIWESGFWTEFSNELPRAPERLADFATRNREYLMNDTRSFVLQVLIAALLAWWLRNAGRAARERAASSPELAASARVLERPISIAVLVSLLVTPWLHPLAPRLFAQMLALIALLPVYRVVAHASPVPVDRTAFAGLFALLLADRMRLALEELPAVAQALFIAECVLGIALAVGVIRRGNLEGRPRWFRAGAQIIAAALGVALIGEIGGWSGLAAMLGRAALGSALYAVYTWAVLTGLDALVAWALRTPRWSNFLADDPLEAQQRARRVARWVTVGTWLYLVLGGVGLRTPVWRAASGVLGSGISIGELSITLGGVLAFALTIVSAPFVARFVNAGLETAVYPRAHLPRGLPFALSRMVSYGVFAVAFLAALAAAGVRMDQLSILLGGLGVGVGLGLQDFVKNFAAGITILFERRVHVGDAVQIPSAQVFGRVMQIGMRAVQVRNWDGAEVIVPNIDLIATAVTNWTLSDQMHRIELPVGVAYGTDPAKVIELLLDVARSHADVIAQPPPMALFMGFGESALDFVLRVWTDSDYDRTSAIRSEIALAVQSRLQGAGIQVPFPQRDLHLASVSPSVRDAILGKDAG